MDYSASSCARTTDPLSYTRLTTCALIQYNQGHTDPKTPYDGERFRPKSRIKDPVFLIIFLVQFAGFCVVSVLALSTWISQGGLGGGLGGDNTGTSVTLDRHTVYLLLFVIATALLLSVSYLILARAYTKLTVHLSLILSILLNVGICIYYYIMKYWCNRSNYFHGHCLVSILSYAGFRSRIPLASLLLQVVMDISKHHKSVFVVALTTLLLQAALSVYATTTYAKWTPGNPACSGSTSCSSGTVAGLVFFETFSYIWTSMVISNVSLTTLAGGPFGSAFYWYYFGPREAGLMPKHPTLSSFWRASTLSLGSIAFGSLIVTVLEITRLLLSALRNNANAEGHPVEACLACCAECFIGCVEGMVQYFNRYAYIEIALYGKPYIRAAKDTWNLFQDRGIDALVNDSLVSITLTWGAYAVGMLCSLFGFLYLRYTHPSYNDQGQYTAPVVLFSFVIGVQLQLTLGAAIEAGVSTIFVGLGEDPGILAVRAPELFGMIADRYPHVVQGVPRV
ncbi:DUF580-domain-containing protein [Multifurca ochricompacta]|uniref:Protein PNS1 n=1 Tax=Multifurca ochricompacta TaxID=376703 RepID=A0AAD4M9Z7_9AGAM|nr:DUF580-domain-containing protein [Multifurca ochricompacta]